MNWMRRNSRPSDAASARKEDLALAVVAWVEAAWYAEVGTLFAAAADPIGTLIAVARGHGLAGCSQFTVERELREGSLVVVRLRGWKVRRTISIVLRLTVVARG